MADHADQRPAPPRVAFLIVVASSRRRVHRTRDVRRATCPRRTRTCRPDVARIHHPDAWMYLFLRPPRRSKFNVIFTDFLLPT
jgi:hypothetical protein